MLWCRRSWNIFAQTLFIAVVRLSKCKSLYVSECEKCYGKQIYVFNPWYRNVEHSVDRAS